MMLWLIALLLGLAAVMQLAVHVAPDLHDAPLKRKARRVKIAGLSLLCGYFGWSAWAGQALHPWLAIGMLLSALAELGFTINRLFPHAHGELPSSEGGA